MSTDLGLLAEREQKKRSQELAELKATNPEGLLREIYSAFWTMVKKGNQGDIFYIGGGRCVGGKFITGELVAKSENFPAPAGRNNETYVGNLMAEQGSRDLENMKMGILAGT